MIGNSPDAKPMFFPLYSIASLWVLVTSTTAATGRGASTFPLIPSNNFLNNLVWETLHFTDKQAVKGLKNTKRKSVVERVLDLKGVSTIKHLCDLRKSRKSPGAVELEGTLEMVLVQSSHEAEKNSCHPVVSHPPNGKNKAYPAFPHQQVLRIKWGDKYENNLKNKAT